MSTETTEPFDLEQVAAQIANLELQQSAISLRISQLKQQVADHCPDGTWPAGDLKVIVSPGRRSIDPKAFAAMVPFEQYPEYYELKPMALSKVEKIEGSARIAGCVRQGARRVAVK
ncbi:MAG: hypothetical protein UHD09_07645 [Bifidobacterium sp.]|nr:hypothetical protein [Bifidobacterium sp.]